MSIRKYGKKEEMLVKKVLASGQLGAINGKYTPMFEEKFAKAIGAKYAVAMNGAMSVLHSSVICSGAGAGSEVICDSIFVFGSLAVLYTNAIPRFVDVDPVTHCMDANQIEASINERTKAVIATHAWGLPANIDKIVEIAHKHKLMVIEDCAHAILATCKGRYAGSWGDIGSFSFQASKQMSLGDGGMATTNSEEIAKALDLNGGAPTLHSIAYGLHYNYRMNEQTSAIGIGQLERMPKMIKTLQRNGRYYDEAIAGCKWLVQQKTKDAVSSCHIWVSTFEGDKYGLSIDEFNRHRAEAGIGIFGIGYNGMPAYKQPVIKDRLAHAFHCKDNNWKIEYPDGMCPVAEHVVTHVMTGWSDVPKDVAKKEAEKLAKVIDKIGRK